MAGLNKIMIIGNVATDPEMRYTPNGNPVTSFRMATNRVYSTADGERHEDTEWFTIVAWSKLAEQCNQYLNKGRRAYVEGRLHSNTWEGQDGQTRFNNEIIANQVVFLDTAQGGQPSDTEAAAPVEAGGPADVDVENLPF